MGDDAYLTTIYLRKETIKNKPCVSYYADKEASRLLYTDTHKDRPTKRNKSVWFNQYDYSVVWLD